VCTKQFQEREQGIQLPVSHTLSDHLLCHGVTPLGRHVKTGSFSSSSMNCMSLDSIIEMFYHLNEMLMATKTFVVVVVVVIAKPARAVASLHGDQVRQRSAGGVLSLSLRIWSIHLQRGRPAGRFHSRLG